MAKNGAAGRKIGILGGTFDPIHMGHLIIAEQAFDQFGLDEVLLIPSGHSYFKDGRAQKVLPPDIRLKMTALASSCHECFYASAIEVLRPGNSYTYETLDELKREDPDSELYYIVGADTVCSIRKWKNPEQIFRQCIMLAASRPDQIKDQEMSGEIRKLEKDFGARVHILNVPEIGISSTDIRERVRNKRSIRFLVPREVEQYIIETGLYL